MTTDAWDDGSTYEAYVGRWSRLVAGRFLKWLAVPPHSVWLDFGCGTGALTRTIVAEGDPKLVIGCDRSADYVAFAANHTRDHRARFQVAELTELPGSAGGFDAVVSGLVLNFLPDPRAAVTALTAPARPGATVAAYVWDYAAGMQLLRFFWDAAVALDPKAAALDEGARFPLCRPEALTELFTGARLSEVALETIEVPTVFENFDAYWRPFLGGQGPAPGYLRSQPSEGRERLREAIRRRLPLAPDGTIALTARAWAVKGMRV